MDYICYGQLLGWNLVTYDFLCDDFQVGCERSEQCVENACSSHGTCTDMWYKYSCTCNRPYYGSTCQNSKYIYSCYESIL